MSDDPRRYVRLARLCETGSFDEVVAAIPYARLLGLSVALREGDPITTMRGAKRLIGNPVLPALHGGTIGALLESAAIFKVIWETRSVDVPKTINITVDYLRSARVVDTHARASIPKRGRRIAHVHVWAWQADESKPVASAHAHFLLKSVATTPEPQQSRGLDPKE